MGQLDSRVAVITGGTRGLGLGIAKAFIEAGASVVVASRSQKSIEEAVQFLLESGEHASGMSMDVTNLEQVEALAEYAISQYGKLDIWVNNAGIAGPYGPTLEFTPDVFNQVVQTNIIGVYNGSRTAMKYFIPQHSGKLINILGHGYNGPVTWQNAYGASKAWVRSFTKSLSEETKGNNVEVLAFNPGMVLTDLLTHVDVIEGSEERLKRFPTIVRMWAKPSEIPAKKMVWLASKATDGKTGLLVSLFSSWLMLSGAAKEGLRSLFHQSKPDIDMQIKTILPFRD